MATLEVADDSGTLSSIAARQEDHQPERPRHQPEEMGGIDEKRERGVNPARVDVLDVTEGSGFVAQNEPLVAKEHSSAEEPDLPREESRPRKLSPKHHDRVDGLKHLSTTLNFPAGEPRRGSDLILGPLQSERLKPSVETSPIRGIVSAVIKLDLWAVTARFVEKGILPDETYLQDDFTVLMHEEMKVVSFGKFRYWGTYEQDKGIDPYVQGFSEDQAIRRLRDLRTRSYLPHMLQMLTGYLLHWQTYLSNIRTSTTFESPERKTEDDLGRINLVDDATNRTRECRAWLLNLYKLILSLQAQTVDAAKAGLLDDVALDALRVRMAAMQTDFPDFCKAIERPVFDFVWSTEPWWRNPLSTDPKPLFIDTSPKNVVHAFPHQDGGSNNNVNSFLAFLVPITSLLSCIPTALSWTHSTHTLGTTTDADFFQLISNTSMQILGILTLMIPTRFNARLVGHPWFWTWLLAAASTACYVAAVPLYLYAPTEWSAAVSFVGNSFQAFTTLQLMFAI